MNPFTAADNGRSYWWQDEPKGKDWINSDHRLPVNSVDAPSGNVYGWIAPYGVVKNGVCELVHFDGSDWYDEDSRTCTVTHWKPMERI